MHPVGFHYKHCAFIHTISFAMQPSQYVSNSATQYNVVGFRFHDRHNIFIKLHPEKNPIQNRPNRKISEFLQNVRVWYMNRRVSQTQIQYSIKYTIGVGTTVYLIYSKYWSCV
jgi:hypothetical protein